MHYALGLGLGVAYGVAAEFRPEVTVGAGTLFGVATATVLDEAAVPALGLAEPPWETDAGTHLFSYASHVVFGLAAELVRR
jgi:putative membrane protein